MKSELRTFKYKKQDGNVKERNLFVIQENENYIAGLDFDLLTEDVKKNIKESLKDHEISLIKKNEKIKGWNPMWNRAWRLFKKSQII